MRSHAHDADPAPQDDTDEVHLDGTAIPPRLGGTHVDGSDGASHAWRHGSSPR